MFWSCSDLVGEVGLHSAPPLKHRVADLIAAARPSEEVRTQTGHLEVLVDIPVVIPIA